jgi:cell division protease FtsH
MNWKKFIPWFVLAGVAVFLSLAVYQDNKHSRRTVSEIKYTDLVNLIEDNKVHDITIAGNEVEGHFADNNREFHTYIPSITGFIEKVQTNKKIQIEAAPPHENGFWTNVFLQLLPVIFFFGLWIWLTRRARGGGGIGGAMGMGKSKAKLLDAEEIKVKFEDVAGVDEAKEDLEEVVEFLQKPDKFHAIGGKIPRGVLLVGPPGTGKTLLAKAVAGEAGVPFFHLSGSDFVEMFVGVGASRVRDMFEQAKKNAPCIIFVDEIDAVGRNRNNGGFSGNDEREQTLNALLVEMDGFNDNEGIIIIAATNRVDVLDPALLRPGRFDRQVTVSNPDITGREKILKVHARKVPLAPDVDLKVVARGTPGFSGADLANLINEAALLAARRSKRIVTRVEFEDARDKILMGAERRTLLMSEDEKKMTAYHEGGHALVSLNMEGSVPIHKATIVPRGRALGMVQSLPERDQISQSYKEMIAYLAMAMGGRVAEELVFGPDNITSGASGDIQQASKIARAMITQYGFSRRLGKVAYSDPSVESFRGPKVAEETQREIDQEVKLLVDEAYTTAKRILIKKRKQLDTLALGLLEYETLSGDEIVDLLDGKVPLREV